MSAIDDTIKMVCERLEDEGIYVEEFFLLAEDEESLETVEGMRQAVLEGKSLGFTVRAAVKDVAFSDRVLHPEKFEQETKFDSIVPDEAEFVVEELRNKLKTKNNVDSENSEIEEQ